MSELSWPKGHRAAGVAAIAFALLSLAIFPAVAPDVLPPLGASPASVSAYFASHRMPFLIGNYLGIAALVPGLVTLSYLCALFRRAEEPEGWSWLIVMSSGVLFFGVAAVDLIVFQVVPFLSTPGLEASARVASDIAEAAFALLMLPALAFTLSVAWSIHQTSALPRWIATSGVVTAILSLVASFGAIWTPPWLVAGGPVTSLVLVVLAGWFVAIGVVLVRKR